jgi:ubiquinone/menaquinone biosynthesis C-methylase UbiE
MAQAYGLAFAQLYDRQSTSFAEETAPLIYEFYLARQPTSTHGKKLLDLCCGTGQLARFFCTAGSPLPAWTCQSRCSHWRGRTLATT